MFNLPAKVLFLTSLFYFLVFSVPSFGQSAPTGTWQTILPVSGAPIKRHENSYVLAGSKFYLMGGRGIKPVQAYDPVNKSWTNRANTPIELHHFQAVTLGGLVYVTGAFTGRYPHETPVSKMYIYNPLNNTWQNGPTIPQARLRGSAGVVVHKNKIYMVCGIKDGHWAGWVNWFDEYDPATNTWKPLPDAPRARDHFQAAVINDKLYLAGGRRSSASTGQTFTLTVPEVDVYNFITGQWSTLPGTGNIPTQRAGTASAVLDNELIIIGGESAKPSAHSETEALNVQTNVWRRLADLKQPRHGTQVINSNNSLYIVAGSGSQGGSPELTSQEVFSMSIPVTSQVISFTLVNSTNDQDIKTLTNGSTINLATIAGRNLNIRANTSPATVGSVFFKLSGAQAKTQVESTKPYALYGDVNGNYNNWLAPVGNYTLTGTPFSAKGGTGTAGSGLTISFTVTDQSIITAPNTKVIMTEKENTNKLTAKVFPNPGDSYFTLKIISKSNKPISVKIFNFEGKLMEGKKIMGANKGLRFGVNYLPGSYYAEVLQGDEKSTIEIVKLKH